MTPKQIRTITCAIFHDGMDVDSLSEKAKGELMDAVQALLKIRKEAAPLVDWTLQHD